MEQEMMEEEGAVEGCCLYEVDEGLSPLQAVLRYSRSDLLPQRHAYLRGIGAVASQAAEHPDPPTRSEQLGSLVELVLEVMAAEGGCEGEEEQETLVLVLEQLPTLGQALQSSSGGAPAGHQQDADYTPPLRQLQGTPEDAAPSLPHQQLVSLLDACLTTLTTHGEDEPLAQRCLAAHAALTATLPATVTQPLVTRHVESLLAGGQSHLTCLGVAMLGACAAEGFGVGRQERELEGSCWTDLVVRVMACAVGPDVDDTIQQAFLHHLPAISLLLPPSTRGEQLLLPACMELATSQVWVVRAAVAATLPLALTALTPSTHTSSPQSIPRGPTAAFNGAPTAAPTAPVSGLTAAPTSTSHEGAAQVAEGHEVVPAVDQAATEALVELLCGRLGKDVSQWVRSAAIKAAGPMIGALARAGSTPPQALVDCYCQCVGAARPQPPDVLQAATACLTQVTQAVTATHAPHGAATDATVSQLIAVYRGLLSSGDRQVIKALVSQLPALATALGPEVAAQQLLPCLLGLEPPELRALARQALLPHTADLAGVLPTAAAPQVLAFVMQGEAAGGAGDECGLHDASGNRRASGSGRVEEVAGDGERVCGAWRDRLALAHQLSRLAVGCCRGGPELLTQLLLPCAVRLCRDPVWAVRQEAARQLGSTLCWAVAERSTALAGTSHAGTQTERQMAVGLGADDVATLLSSVLELAGVHHHPASPDHAQASQGTAACTDVTPAMHETKLADVRLFVQACMGFLHACMPGVELHDPVVGGGGDVVGGGVVGSEDGTGPNVAGVHAAVFGEGRLQELQDYVSDLQSLLCGMHREGDVPALTAQVANTLRQVCWPTGL